METQHLKPYRARVQPAALTLPDGRVAWLSIVAAVAVGLSLVMIGCSTGGAPEQGPTVTAQAVSVQREEIAEQVTAEAVVYPLHQAAIVPKISAPVSKFYVNRGSRVKAGELLAELEHADLAAAVTESKGAYEQARATYETAVKAGLPEEMQKAELDTKAAKQLLGAQQKVFDSRQKLYQQGAIPRKDLEDATVTLTQARNQYEVARKHLDSLQSFGSENALKAAQGELMMAKGKYEAAEAQLNYSQIRSPIAGVVTDRPLHLGEMAAAGTPLITVMDLASVVARAHVTRQQAALLVVGDKATLSEPGVAEGIPGTLTVVSPALDPNSTTVEVWVEAANPGDRLKPGSTVRAAITARSVSDALVIPADALLTAPDGTTSVMVVAQDNKPTQQNVTVGIRQGEQVQVIKGLQGGERVVTVGAYGLFHEDPDVLAKTRLEIQEPAASDSGSSKDPGKD